MRGLARALWTRLAHATSSTADNHKGLSPILGKQSTTVLTSSRHDGLVFVTVTASCTEVRRHQRRIPQSIVHTDGIRLRRYITSITGTGRGHCRSGQTWHSRADNSPIILVHFPNVPSVCPLSTSSTAVSESVCRTNKHQWPLVGGFVSWSN